ncbi:MAG: hypothetical protein JXA43_00965 [Candidatus Diapherotrites archaeon]|nr:hypothetical protein [Candidatus Diapherotrites archaeon]
MSEISDKIKAKLIKEKGGPKETSRLEETLGGELAEQVRCAPLSNTISDDVRNSIEFENKETGEIKPAPESMTNAELIALTDNIPRTVGLKTEDWGLMAVQGHLVLNGPEFDSIFENLTPLGKVFANSADELTMDQMASLSIADEKDRQEREEYEKKLKQLTEENKGKAWFVETPDGKKELYSLESLTQALNKK